MNTLKYEIRSYEDYKKVKDEQDVILDKIFCKLDAYPKESNGMTIESIRMTYEYRQIKQQFQTEFELLKQINRFGAFMYAKDIYKDRKKGMVYKK